MKFFDRFFGSGKSDDQSDNIPETSKASDAPQTPEVPQTPATPKEITLSLAEALELHKERRTEETMLGVFQCLQQNPVLWVPLSRSGSGYPDIRCSEGGIRAIPVFTDMKQVSDTYRQQCCWGQMRFQELKPYLNPTPKLTGIVINGFSHAFMIHAMTFPMFFEGQDGATGVTEAPQESQSADGRQKESIAVIPHTLKENQTFRLAPAGQEAEALKSAAIRFLSTHNCQKAYFGRLTNNGQESYLFAIEQTGCPDKEFFRLMHQELSAVPALLPIDYTSYEGFRKHITADNCQMIYQQNSQDAGN